MAKMFSGLLLLCVASAEDSVSVVQVALDSKVAQADEHPHHHHGNHHDHHDHQHKHHDKHDHHQHHHKHEKKHHHKHEKKSVSSRATCGWECRPDQATSAAPAELSKTYVDTEEECQTFCCDNAACMTYEYEANGGRDCWIFTQNLSTFSFTARSQRSVCGRTAAPENDTAAPHGIATYIRALEEGGPCPESYQPLTDEAECAGDATEAQKARSQASEYVGAGNEAEYVAGCFIGSGTTGSFQQRKLYFNQASTSGSKGYAICKLDTFFATTDATHKCPPGYTQVADFATCSGAATEYLSATYDATGTPPADFVSGCGIDGTTVYWSTYQKPSTGTGRKVCQVMR